MRAMRPTHWMHVLYATGLHNHAFASGGFATLAVARVIYAFGAPAAKVEEVRVGLAINFHSIQRGGNGAKHCISEPKNELSFE